MGSSVRQASITEVAANQRSDLTKAAIDAAGFEGWELDGPWCNHTIMATNLGGRTWSLQYMRPDGTFAAVPGMTGLTIEVVQFGPRFSGVVGTGEVAIRMRAHELRVVYSAPGAGAVARLRSELVDS